MARGDHPQRASSIHVRWLSIAIYVAVAIAAVSGFVMTFGDYSF
jgi:hypothetical protein